MNSKFFLFLFLIMLFTLFYNFEWRSVEGKGGSFKLNTSNPGKLKEFRSFFKEHGIQLEVSRIDLDEVDADPLTVIVHKASQVDEGILVEDTSLDVEGADVGVNVRWLIEGLDNFLGRKATWTVLLAHRQNGKVYVYKGEVAGKIIQPKNKENGFGFDPYFLPAGTTKTLSEEKIDRFNARALAVENFVCGNTFKIVDPIYQWEGKWQEH